MTIRITLRRAEGLKQNLVTFVMGFARQGSAFLGLVHEPALALPESPEAVIDVVFAPVYFGSGTWFLNLGIGEPGIYDRPVVHYFATDPSWYHLLASRIELQVLSAGGLDTTGCFVVHPATVTVAAVPDHVNS
jgi:hypothetical protein